MSTEHENRDSDDYKADGVADPAEHAIPSSPGSEVAGPVGFAATAEMPFIVVGIGASAGGIQALIEFLETLPTDTGMAFIVIQHQPPDYESHLAEVFQRHTQLPVVNIEDGTHIEPDHLYVIRPDSTVTIQRSRFRLGASVDEHGHRRPVDDFFRSLAAAQREKAVAIVLSGVGTNGTSGAQAIKAAGGLCIAQDPDSADFGGMPRSLIHSGYADQVLKPADMPAVLIRYSKHAYQDPEHRGRASAQAALKQEREHLTQIFAILRTRTGHNFAGYKKPTVLRRIQRRMGLAGLTRLREYADFLRDNLDEPRALATDLMINVTGFFRDAPAWEAMRTSVIAPLIERCPADGTIRAWVTACASGEEAYSLAMLLTEEMERQDKHVEVKIFATDTADSALAYARAGVYPAGIEGDLSVARLERFFDKEEHTYRIKKALRDSVVFAAHDVLRDPPFSRVDLCTCRNLLIYLEPEIQQRVMFMLHFALREGGYLFLGTAETPGSAEKLFDIVSKKWRIYQRIGAGQARFDVSHLLPSALPPIGRREPVVAPAPARPSSGAMIQQSLLDQIAPPTLVVDRSDQIIYFSGDTTPYIVQPSGEPTRELFECLRPAIRSAVRTALRKASAGGVPMTVLTEMQDDDTEVAKIHVTAAPLVAAKVPEYFRISFERSARHEPATDSAQTDAGATKTPAMAVLRSPAETGLEDELRVMRRELQSTVEAFEASNEELKAANEEVVSINEELQSANEELETGKEELQSLNEELITVNAQLQAKIAELEATTNDLSNLLSSTNIAVVFLDTQFRVRRFTPAVHDLLELIPGDIGRPIANLAEKFVSGGGLLDDARTVLSRLIPLESEVLSDSGSWYLRRTLPYRTADNHIDGVVITFVDITARKRAEQVVADSQARLEAVVNQLPIALMLVEADKGTLVMANEPAAELLGLPHPMPLLGSEWTAAATGVKAFRADGVAYRPDEWPLARTLATGASINHEEIECRYVDGSLRVLSVSSAPVKDGEGKIVAAVSTFFDITERRRVEAELREKEQRLQLFVDSALDYAIIMLDLNGRISSWNTGAERMLGWKAAEAAGQSAAIIFTAEDRAAGIPEREIETACREGQARDERAHVRKDGSRFWGSGMLVAVRDERNTLRRFAKIIRDETQRHEIEGELQRALLESDRVRTSAENANRAKDEFISTISHELRTPLNTIRLWARMLGNGKVGESDFAEGIRMIDRAAESQQTLIDDLLDVSRMSSGQLRLNIRITKLADAVRGAVESIRPSAESRGIKLGAALSEDVGLVRADPDRIQQVVWNLLSNAVKFTPSGGRIDVDLRREGRDVIIVVSDTGAGIRKDFLPHVFERFRQAEVVTTRQHGGLGLGLAIAKQLVDLHGGTIAVGSEGEGRGSTFRVRLPLAFQAGVAEVSDPHAAQAAEDLELTGMRVLLVEDDSQTREATRRLLTLTGARVEAVATAAAAFDAYEAESPDMMLCDIGLPGEDGYSLVQRIRELERSEGRPRIPVIAVTAFAREKDRARATECGFDEHIAKPVDVAALLAALARFASHKKE